LCLLLTLLAVPVFYSLFEDAKDSSVWARAGAGFNNLGGGLRRRAGEAYASFAGGLSRKTKPTADALRRQDQKDRYADQASGD
jgi:HAE1 family hydrophobic/amphiphilic exporter-1